MLSPDPTTRPSDELQAGTAPTLSESAPAEVARDWLGRMQRAVALDDPAVIATLFAKDGWLRDRLALTWDLRTFRGADAIRRMLADRLPIAKLTNIELDERIEPTLVESGEVGRWVQASFSFETASGGGRGFVRLVDSPAGGAPVAWTVVLDLRELKGHEEIRGERRPFGVEHGATRSKTNWLDRRDATAEFVDADPVVMIVGAGQSGLALAARLGQLQIPTLVVERQGRIGDTWRNRYRSLVLHDPVWTNHLPYMPFPDTWPRFIPKDKLADWFEGYAKAMELNVWTDSAITDCTRVDAETWEVTVARADGSERTLRPRHLVFATGHSGLPRLPQIPGADEFAGELIHASAYRETTSMEGREVVVVGAGNSSHDICHDLVEAEAGVTMVQRSSTYVHSSEAAYQVVQKGLFDEGGPATEDADHIANSLPLPALFDLLRRHVTPQIREHDAELLDGLRRAGYSLDEESSLLELYLTRGGGYYVEVGAAAAIAEGRIKVKSGVEVERFTVEGVVYTDGTEQRADTVIMATGYGSMKDVARSVVGDEIVDRCETVWGVNAEGEMNSIWRSSGYDGLWFFGGNLASIRHYSLTLALQIKADEEGLLQRYKSDAAPSSLADV